MNRTYEQIEADLTAAYDEVRRLDAELNAVQPDELVLKGLYHGARLDIHRGDSPSSISAWGTRDGTKHYVGGFFGDQPAKLRDWLNYHFPKTEENA